MNWVLSPPPRLTASTPELVPLIPLLSRLPTGLPSPHTRWRWIRKGVSGVRLPAVLIADRWYSTQEAVDWFIAARTQRALDDALPEEMSDVSVDELAAVGL